MAGLAPAGVLCEIVTDDCSEMMRAPELKVFAEKHGLVFTSIHMKMYRRGLVGRDRDVVVASVELGC